MDRSAVGLGSFGEALGVAEHRKVVAGHGDHGVQQHEQVGPEMFGSDRSDEAAEAVRDDGPVLSGADGPPTAVDVIALGTHPDWPLHLRRPIPIEAVVSFAAYGCGIQRPDGLYFVTAVLARRG